MHILNRFYIFYQIKNPRSKFLYRIIEALMHILFLTEVIWWKYLLNRHKRYHLLKERLFILSDIAEVCCVPENEKNKNIGNLVLLAIDKDKDGQYLVSAIDIVKKVSKAYPWTLIYQYIGETETLIEYFARPKNENKILEKIKIIFVCTVLFGGAMTAIMSFHSDAQMPAVFQNMYRIFFGVEASKPYIIYIPYSIGLAAGIIIFFNHFGMKKISRDPTPIEVEMTTYAKESADSIIDRLGKEKNNGNN